MEQLQIAIDGPASSGKSTIAQMIAKELSLVYIDTGAMYRALTYAALEHGIDVADESKLLELLSHMTISFKPTADGQKVYVNDTDITKEIRENKVSQNVSEVSAHPHVREALVKLQKELAGKHSVIMDGRDIGTVVLPDAPVKIFLVASVDVRAQRRHLENQSRGISSTFEQIKADLIERDALDTSRKHSPLKKAMDAIEVDTTALTIHEVVAKILEIIKQKMNEG
ncbi:(d)CMP kinase [Allofustis seminis]|uniref:(d)CMP kinase n=1 Tax=Allofustis seminis TaxID=166939 RepID=UPI000375B71B|nr:(d)CMP kinase [Allofustis seminis]